MLEKGPIPLLAQPEAPGGNGVDTENIRNLCNDYLKTVICMEKMHISEDRFRCATDACAAWNAKTKKIESGAESCKRIYSARNEKIQNRR